jgi:O-antigen ligase
VAIELARALNPRGWLLGGAHGKQALWIAWQRTAPGIVSFSVVLVDGLAGGAYLPRPWRLTTFALLAFALAALVGRRRIALARIEWWFLGFLAALTAWTAASTIWSDTPGTSWLEAERDVVYLAGAAALLLALERESLLVLLAGLLGGITTVAGYGLATYVIYDHPLNPIQGKLLFEPLGYANGLGIFAALGILLAIGIATSLEPRPLRLACLAPLGILVPTLYLTESRAALASLAIGLVVLIRFGRPIPKPLTAALAAGAAIAIALVAVAAASEEHRGLRLLVGENRPHYWRVAWREVEMNRLLGSGAGTFERYWLHYRTIGSFARDAHSLYLETLAELGPIGLVLLLVALGLPLALLRGRRDPLLATAAGAYVAYLVHTGVDWDWELPAVTLAGLLCGSSMLLATRSSRAPALGRWTRLALITAASGLAIVALVRLETGPRLPFSP